MTARSRHGLAWGLLAVLAACAALPVVGPIVLSALQHVLRVATDNYTGGYADELHALFDGVLEPGQAPAAAEPWTLEAAVAELEDGAVRGLEDGAALYDGHGDERPAQRFALAVRSSRRCYLYVFGVDATAWAAPLFPPAAGAGGNPVEAGATIELPGRGRALQLDANAGIETFYVLASVTPRPDVEQRLRALQGRPRPRTVSPRAVEQAAVATRGVEAPRGTLSIRGRPVPSVAVTAGDGAGELLLTRWIDHR